MNSKTGQVGVHNVKPLRTPPVTEEVLEAVRRKVETPQAYINQADPNNPNLAIDLAKYQGKLELLNTLESWHKQFMKER